MNIAYTDYKINNVIWWAYTVFWLCAVDPVTEKPCDLKPCKNNGICVSEDTIGIGYHCLCLDNFIGENCKKSLHIIFNNLDIMKYNKICLRRFIFSNNFLVSLHDHRVFLDLKECICHFLKWQIDPFISKGTFEVEWPYGAVHYSFWSTSPKFNCMY